MLIVFQMFPDDHYRRDAGVSRKSNMLEEGRDKIVQCVQNNKSVGTRGKYLLVAVANRIDSEALKRPTASGTFAKR